MLAVLALLVTGLVGAATPVSAQGGSADVAIFTTENGAPAYDACYVLVGYSNVGCDENRDGRVMFAAIPYGTYTVRQTANLGAGRYINDFTIQVRGNINSAGFESFSATIVNSTGGSSAASSGSVDIALITREPVNGDLLTDACYVLVGYSNEGCDENGDGQVTFADIPFGTYTVRQTRTPAGYPTINDYEINVAPMHVDGGGESPGVPHGFIVKQATEQNAPNTRNVSVILVNGSTFETVVSGACVELVGASNVGCDEDLLDGQIDFLDVPAGGPYELRFTNVRSGYEVVTLYGPLSYRISAEPGDLSNKTIFVWMSGSGSGSTGSGAPDGSAAETTSMLGDWGRQHVLLTLNADGTGMLTLNHGCCDGVTHYLSVDMQSVPVTATIVDTERRGDVESGETASIGEAITLQLTQMEGIDVVVIRLPDSEQGFIPTIPTCRSAASRVCEGLSVPD